MLGSIKRD